MKIKHQVIWLSALIVSIPCMCVIFLLFFRYITSSKRLVLNGSDTLESSLKDKYTKNEWKAIKDAFRHLPEDVDGVFLLKDKKNDTFEIVLSTTLDYSPYTIMETEDFWRTIQNSTEQYFYQFSKINDNDNSIYLTRVPKKQYKNQEKKRKPSVIYQFVFILAFFISIILLIVIYVFRNIFKAISLLEKSTHDVAEGKLNTQIVINSKHFNDNEITNISKSLEKMRISLVEAQNRKTKLIMGISHDLRTPVAVIKGYTEALKDGIFTEQDDKNSALNLIEAKTAQLESMIDSLINYTKMDTKEIHDSLIEENIATLIINFGKECKNACDVFKRNIETDINLPNQVIVPMNIQLVNRAFENIFSNALRYTRENDSIKIISYIIQKENNLILQICDSGIGISENDLPHIFDLFYRASASRHEEGMGIGLSVVQNIMEIHGWTIAADSKINEGTTFTVTIPIKA